MDGQLIVILFVSVIGLLVAAAIFLICRALVLWYFRINEMADDLHVIAQHYRQLANPPLPTRPSAQSGSTRPRQSLPA
jgi:ABC-type bacteriocin/lantibiotic exporter with double-glycine peptidase domain